MKLLLKEFGLYTESFSVQKFIRYGFRAAAISMLLLMLYWMLRFVLVNVLPDDKSEFWNEANELYRTGVYEWIFYSFAGCMLLIFTLRIFFEVRFSGKVALIIFVVCGVLMVEDFFWNEFHFFVFKGFHIKYYQALLVVPVFEVMLRLIYVLRRPEKIANASVFIENKPLNKMSDLQNTRKIFVENLVAEIKKSSFEKAYSIGIVGEWGVGKTSFMRGIEEALDDSSIVIHFSPWLSASSTSVLHDFAKVVSEKLRDYDTGLVNSMNEYIHSLIEVEKNVQTNVIQTLNGLVNSEPSNESQFNRINDAIERIKKRLVIFIDDMDRLDSGEIIEVLKLIRNAANFSNVIYISSYDKVYLLHALMKFNKRNLGIMLDKFFDLEISVAPIVQKDILTKIDTMFFRTLNDRQAEVIRLYEFLKENNPFLQYREVNKFLTSLQINYKIYGFRLFLEDFFVFEILKVKHAYLPGLLWRNRKKYFQEPGASSVITLKMYTPELSILEQDFTVLNKDQFNRLFLRPEDLILLSTILDKLFKGTAQNILAIREMAFFDSYFYHEIPDVDIDAETFDLLALIHSEQYRTHNFFRTGYDIKKEIFITEAFERIEKRSNDRSKIIVFLVFLIDWSNGTINSDFITTSCDPTRMHEAHWDELHDAFRKYDKRDELFSRMKFLNTQLVNSLQTDDESKSLFTIEEAQRLNADLFSRFLELSGSVTNKVFFAYNFQLGEIDRKTGNQVPYRTAVQLLKTFVARYPDSYFDRVIRSAAVSNYELIFIFDRSVMDMFTREEFVRLIAESNYPARKRSKLEEYLERAIINADGIYELKAEPSDLTSMPVEFRNMWSAIPANIKEKNRTVNFVANHEFNAQPSPPGFEERNDDFYREIFELENMNFLQIEITPINTPFWRFGFSFLEKPAMPNRSEGRHFDTEKADIHVTVGEQVNQEWALANQIELKQYHIDPISSDFSRFMRYDGTKPVVVQLSKPDARRNEWLVDLVVSGNPQGSRRYDMKNFKYVVLSAWCDRRKFHLHTKITLFQPVKS